MSRVAITDMTPYPPLLAGLDLRGSAARIEDGMNDEEYTKLVNKTSRRKGAVGKDPLCYRYARDLLSNLPPADIDILDFGCGKGATHAQALQEWLNNYPPYATYSKRVWAYDIGANSPQKEDNYITTFPYHSYDMVILSNVLNVQPDPDLVVGVLNQAWKFVKPGGGLVVNYPHNPRYSGMHYGEVSSLIHNLPELKSVGIYPGRVWGVAKMKV